MKYCNETTTLESLLLQSDDRQNQARKNKQPAMNSGSNGSLKSIETSSSKPPPPLSPTASVTESNIVVSTEQETAITAGSSSPNRLQSLKFDAVDLDEVEVQSPDSSLWDSLFADQIADSSVDFMLISSPRRDFMVAGSPRRDYMIISSPKRDYMISSPKREYMHASSPKREYMHVSSPKREYMVTPIYNNYGYAHGAHGYGSCTTANNTSSKGKSSQQSPLHKVYKSSTSSAASPYDVQVDSHALPVMDAFLDEYKAGYGVDEAYDAVAAEAQPQLTEAAVGGMTATLLECLSIPSLTMKYGEAMGVGLAVGACHDHDGYGMSHQQQEEVHGGREMAIAKQEMVDASSFHGLPGPVACDNIPQEQDSGLQLVHHLLACAESVAKDDYLTARRFLHHLNRIVSPLGDSMQRVASCFVDALSYRLSPPIPSSHKSSPSLDTLKIYQILYQACPYIKFAHFTANQAIFEAFDSEDRVHVIDLDILQGYQWPAFLQALAARPGGPPTLRITGVGYPSEAVRETGHHLAELAHSLRVPFEFHPAVADRLQDLRPHMLHRRVGEALAVNSVNRLHRVPSPHLGNLLAMIRDQAPNIVTLVEQEASHNGPHFLGRFLEALHYYSAIFDSLDATFPADSAARAKVEQYIFAPEIRNIVACEGPDRVERHERLEKWRKTMEGRGFKGVPLSQNAVTQSKILLGLYPCDGYRLTEEKGSLLLGWQDRAIIAASAWRC